MHDPSWRSPEPVWSAVWRPGLVVCTPCLPLLKVVGEAEKTRDCCGHVCAGADVGDPIVTTTVWCGALASHAGACRDCHPGEPS